MDLKGQELIEGALRTTALKSAWDDIIAFNNKHFQSWRSLSEIYYSNAIAGEAGGLCNMVKKRLGGGTKGNMPDESDMMYELADIFIYLVLMAESKGHNENDFAMVVMAKMEENRRRMVR